MNGVKQMLLVYLLIIASLILVDISIVQGAEGKMKSALNRAIDGGIIYGTIEEDYARGNIQLDESKVREGIRNLLQSNLELDSSLSNEAFKNGRLIVNITYNAEHVPRIEASFTSQIALAAGKIVGLDTYELDITKRTPFLSDYK